MKNWGIIFFSLFIISCNTQNQPATSDSAERDTLISKPENTETQTKVVSYCSELVKNILISSPRYRQLTNGLLEAVKKNGGTSVDIILDKSPNPEKDNSMEYSATYEMQISENYPDRHVNIAHFTFDPLKNQLYEYDVVRDQLITVEYNIDLLDEPEKFCK